MVDELSIICKAMPEFTKEQIKEIVDKAQATEENKKTWDSLDIIKKIEVIRHTLKPKPQFEPPEDVSTPQSKNSKGQVNMDNQSNKGLIYAVVIGVVVLVASVMFGSSQFVSKADFTKNIQGMSAVVDKAVSGVNQTKDTLSSKIAEIPGMITTQTSAMNNQILQISQQLSTLSTDLNNKFNSLNTSYATTSQEVTNSKKEIEVLAKSINDISGNITNLYSSLSVLSANLTNKDDVKKLQDKISSLQTQLDSILSQYTANNISVTSLSVTANMTSAVAQSIPVQVTNNGTSPVTMTLKLALTTATSETITGINMNRAFTYTLANPNVTFFTDITVDANSTVTLNPQVTLTYTGTSPNVWNVAWSKN